MCGAGDPQLSVKVMYCLPPNGTEPPGATTRVKFRRGESDGMRFATSDAAFAHAYARGYCQQHHMDWAWVQDRKARTREWRQYRGEPVSARRR